MTKEELIRKLAQRNATKQVEKQQATEPTPQAEQAQTEQPKGYTLEYFRIRYHEGRQTPDFTNTIFYSWQDIQDAFFKLWEANEKGQEGGYTKVGIELKFKEDEAAHTPRIDITNRINNGDFNPSQQDIKEYIKQSFFEEHEYLKEEQTEQAPQQEQTEQPQPQENKTNLSEIPELLNQLIGIVETIEESEDRSETALIKASEQVERAKAYSLYLQAITPILEAKANAMIEAQHRGKIYKTNLQRPANENLN